ncbi:MAG: cation diffusion facilitator family transporter [Phormidesmis sp.]
MRRCNCPDIDCSDFDLSQGDLLRATVAPENLLQGKLPEPNQPSDHKLRVLRAGLLLSGGFSLFEWTAGWWSQSLTLMTDAGHMLSDCLALSLAIGAAWLAHLAVRQKQTLGPQKAEIAAALANGVGLLVLAVWVMWEVLNRVQGGGEGGFQGSGHAVGSSEVVLVTAIVGLGVNIMAASILHDHSQHDLNVRGAFLHVLADTVSSAGVIVSAVLIWAFHWCWVDEVVSLCLAVVIGIGALPLIFESVRSLQKSL